MLAEGRKPSGFVEESFHDVPSKCAASGLLIPSPRKWYRLSDCETCFVFIARPSLKTLADRLEVYHTLNQRAARASSLTDVIGKAGLVWPTSWLTPFGNLRLAYNDGRLKNGPMPPLNHRKLLDVYHLFHDPRSR